MKSAFVSGFILLCLVIASVCFFPKFVAIALLIVLMVLIFVLALLISWMFIESGKVAVKTLQRRPK